MDRFGLESLRDHLAALRSAALAALTAADVVDLGALNLLTTTHAALNVVNEEIANIDETTGQ